MKEKKGAFLRWPWNVVAYVLLFAVLRLFAIPVVLLLMWVQERNNPHGVREGYCLSRTRKRLTWLLWALGALVMAAGMGVVFVTGLDQDRALWELSDHVTQWAAGGGAVLLALLALWLGKRLGTVPEKDCREMVAAFRELPGKMEEVLSHRDDIQYFASQHFNHDSIFFMGRNLDYALGLEGSLKLKEISYIHSEAYASGELKHGTISLIEEGTLVVALGTYGKLFAKAMSNVVEVKSRGASVLALTTYPHQEEMARTADVVMTIPDIHTLLLPILGVVPLQLFAYYVALMRGCDIDKPRNLAKSVTVE